MLNFRFYRVRCLYNSYKKIALKKRFSNLNGKVFILSSNQTVEQQKPNQS